MPLQMFTNQFRQLQMELRSQNLSQRVRTFGGESGKKFTEWLRDMERCRVAVTADDERMRALALMTLTGPAAEFVARGIRENPDVTWVALKAEMRGRYSDLADALYARQTLRKVKQKKGESVQNFVERMTALAEEAYPEDDIDDPQIQQQLVEIMVDGIQDDGVAKRLIRSRPDTLANALTIATREQQTTRTFELYRKSGHEPMEVDAIAPDSRLSRIEEQLCHLGRQVEEVTIAALESQRNRAISRNLPQGPPPNRPFNNQSQGPPASQNRPAYQWTSDNRPICYFCNIPGHVQINCRKKQAHLNGIRGSPAEPRRQ